LRDCSSKPAHSTRETGHIQAAKGPLAVKDWREDPHLYAQITVLAPKTDSPEK
jgi:hypothetical protein